MPIPILRGLPYFTTPTRMTVGDDVVTVNPFQIVVWVAVATKGRERSARFPAVLDTGCGTSFIISPSMLSKWAGINWRSLVFERGIERRHAGIIVPHRRADIWLLPNQYDCRDEIDPILPPTLLELQDGIAVFGDGEQVGNADTKKLVAPRLPLLGLRALASANLALKIDSQNRRVWLDQLSA